MQYPIYKIPRHLIDINLICDIAKLCISFDINLLMINKSSFERDRKRKAFELVI
jgi:hypothetical protein